MTIRHAIDQLLTGETASGEATSDPASVLSEQGFDDVPSELFGTALVHFSDTAPIEQADALAPIVTRVSPVPLEESDLPAVDGAPLDLEAIENGDAFSLFQTVSPVAPTVSDEADLADSTFDETDEVDEAGHPNDAEVEAANEAVELDQPESESFGQGSDEELPSEDTPELDSTELDGMDLDELPPRYEAGSYYEDDALSGVNNDIDAEDGPDLFSVEFDETDQADEGTDPNDLDFDFE